MKCTKRGCKSDKVAQSRFHPNLSYCDECKDFSTISTEEYKQLEQEGMLRYDVFQERQRKRIEEREKRIEEQIQAAKPRRSLSRSTKRTNKKTKKPVTTKKNKKKAHKKSEPKTTTGPVCSDHPNYGVIRKPRTDCKVCWKAYKKKFPERV